MNTPDVREAPRLLLFDDDPFFIRMMEQCARTQHIPLTGVWQLEDITNVVQSDFDLAIIDFDLGDINGLEIAEFLDEVFVTMPSILISYSRRCPSQKHPWPRSIQDFVLKDEGPLKILEAALALTERRH